MGQVDLPQLPPVASNPQNMAAVATPAELADCRSPCHSPGSQWEQSTPYFPMFGSEQKRLQPTEFEPSPSFIPNVVTSPRACVTDVDQMSCQAFDLMPGASASQQSLLPSEPLGFVSEPMQCVYVVPICIPQHHGGLQPFGNGGDFVQERIEPGYADSYTAPSLSVSTTRRRRRQRAAALHPQQGDHNDRHTHQGDHVKTPLTKEPRRPKKGAEMLARLEAGGEGLHAALVEVTTSAQDLTFDVDGCRVIQLALQKADHQHAARLCEQLHGCVRRAIESPYGYYVIQRIVELMPASLSTFVSRELLSVGTEVARQPFGCRILCRLLEHCSAQPLTIQLIDETLPNAHEFIRDGFAHHVIESTLAHGTVDQKHMIALALQADVFGYASDVHSTYVIESAFKHCSLEDRDAIVAAFLADKDGVLCLAEHMYGFHVVRMLLKYAEQRSYIAALLQKETCRLEASYYGSSILALINAAA